MKHGTIISKSDPKTNFENTFKTQPNFSQTQNPQSPRSQGH